MDSGKQIYKAQIILSRGAWLEFEVDKRDQLMVSIDRKRKQSATMFLRALGIAVTNSDIIELLGNSDVIKRTLERDTALTSRGCPHRDLPPAPGRASHRGRFPQPARGPAL